ncbi:MAG TPA: Ig-like domain-containing protein, partial [Blastocatellia bacterium]|nr:Ig-like domain-containing protein [Blastocatellia bacterium]
PAMVKAFLTNSASYMTGVNAGGDLPHQRQGWGLTNLGRALDGTPRLLIDQTQTFANTGSQYTLKGRVADPSKPFRVTLAWTDAPGAPFANPVVNDLDLRVEVGGRVYLGNQLAGDVSIEGGAADKLNNIESVWLPAGATGDFVVRVNAANLPGDGVPNNSDATDQDFALVVYNAQPEGGGDGNPVDAPPTVNLRYPNGGEKLLVGDLVRILWDASDDKAIQSHRVEFSSDGGLNYNTIAILNGGARGFDWRIPAIPTTQARIRVTALDGVNLPVSATSLNDFEVASGPPDTTPPQVLLISPNSDSLIAGGQTTTIKWKESDNVGVIQRVIELSTDGGNTFQQIISLTAPSSGEDQSYDWQVPAALYTDKGKVRISVYDGAGNVAMLTSQGRFEVWALPIITSAKYERIADKNDHLELKGRGFRIDQTEIYVDGKKLKNIRFNEKCDFEGGTCTKVTSADKKIHKRVPLQKFVNIVVKLKKTGQTSPAFSFKRKRPS